MNAFLTAEYPLSSLNREKHLSTRRAERQVLRLALWLVSHLGPITAYESIRNVDRGTGS
jgi:hypothetical protein